MIGSIQWRQRIDLLYVWREMANEDCEKENVLYDVEETTLGVWL